MNRWFWVRANKHGPIHEIYGQCWVWTGGTCKDGYGKVKLAGSCLDTITTFNED